MQTYHIYNLMKTIDNLVACVCRCACVCAYCHLCTYVFVSFLEGPNVYVYVVGRIAHHC